MGIIGKSRWCFDRLKVLMNDAFEAVWDAYVDTERASSGEWSMRKAAYVLAVGRVVEAMRMRGWEEVGG